MSFVVCCHHNKRVSKIDCTKLRHADTFGLYANVGVKEKWPEASVVDDILVGGVLFFLCIIRREHVAQIYTMNTFSTLNNIR